LKSVILLLVIVLLASRMLVIGFHWLTRNGYGIF